MLPSGDVRDNYWSRKWRYLEQHFDRKTALQKMKEAYAKSGIFTDVRSGGREGRFILTDLQGKEKGVFYHDPKSLFGGGRPLSREKLLMYYEETKQFYETMLKRDIMLLKLRGGEKYVTGKRADDMIRILLGKGSPEEKIKKLESIHVLTPGADHAFHSIVHNFKATDQLKKRFADRLKRKQHQGLMEDLRYLERHVDTAQLRDPDFVMRDATQMSTEPNGQASSDSPGALNLEAEVVVDPDSRAASRYLLFALIIIAAGLVVATVIAKLRRQRAPSQH